MTDIATGFCGPESVDTKEVRACETSARAFSGSSDVEVLNVRRRGRRYREIDWSAGVLGDWRRSVRMQFAATFAVCDLLARRCENGKERAYHAVTEAVKDFIKEAGDEGFGSGHVVLAACEEECRC